VHRIQGGCAPGVHRIFSLKIISEGKIGVTGFEPATSRLGQETKMPILKAKIRTKEAQTRNEPSISLEVYWEHTCIAGGLL